MNSYNSFILLQGQILSQNWIPTPQKKKTFQPAGTELCSPHSFVNNREITSSSPYCHNPYPRASVIVLESVSLLSLVDLAPAVGADNHNHFAARTQSPMLIASTLSTRPDLVVQAAAANPGAIGHKASFFLMIADTHAHTRAPKVITQGQIKGLFFRRVDD